MTLLDQKVQIKLTRKQLYDEIWELSVMGVAKKYDVNYSGLLKLCQTENIPYPPSSYWTKMAYDKSVEKAALPGLETDEITLPNKFIKKPSKNKDSKKDTLTETKVSDKTEAEPIVIFENTKEKEIVDKTNRLEKDGETISFLTDDERVKVLLVAQEITISVVNDQLHKKIKSYKKTVKEWNEKDNKPEFSQRTLSNYSKNPPFLAGVISDETLPRVYRILDTLFLQIEKLGGTINDDLSVQIRNERVVFEVSEMQDKLEHILTKKEAYEMIEYEDRKKRNSWASKPNFRKYDYVFNGKLRINILKGKYFKDTEKDKIEDYLGNIIIELYAKSELVRIDREAREEAERQRREVERLREESQQRYNSEVKLTKRLENEALDYEKASRIRSYIKAVENAYKQNEIEDEIKDWVEWANKKADWFDPTVARDDEFFGKRQHEKNIDEKVLKKLEFYW